MKKLYSEIPFIESERITIKKLEPTDASSLQELMDDARVYELLPTFLFEHKYGDAGEVISRLYDECIKDSIILGIFENGDFCGLAEFYGYREPMHKISVGYRLLRRFWGKGIASETLRLMVDYLYGETDCEIITASSLPENIASASVLRKNGFSLVVKNSPEDWGYDELLPTDKWIR